MTLVGAADLTGLGTNPSTGNLLFGERLHGRQDFYAALATNLATEAWRAESAAVI